MDMALGHLDQVVSRTKDVPDFNGFVKNMLYDSCIECEKCAFAFYNYFNERHEAFRQLVQQNPEPTVRQEAGSLFLASLEFIKDRLPHLYDITPQSPASEIEVDGWGEVDLPVIRGAVKVFNSLWVNFHTNIRSWHEFFSTVTAFGQMGEAEMVVLLAEDYLHNSLRIIWADPSMDLPNNYARMVNTVARRMATRPPAYGSVILLIEQLMSALNPCLDNKYVPSI